MTWDVSTEDLGAGNPYIHWWWEQENPGRRTLFRSIGRALAESLDRVQARPAAGPGDPGQADPAAGDPRRPILNARVPVPAHARTTFEEVAPWRIDDIVGHFPTDLPADTVITAIVDTGITPGHRRFRHADGTSRVLAAWQQTASFGGQAYLPFGQEIHAGDIDRALDAHSPGGIARGALDEDGFNRALRLVEPQFPLGHRDLDHRAAHGTHVADLAAGFDAAETDPEVLRAHPMLLVNLPPQSLHGSAGNFLAFWALFAVKRILHLADAISAASADTAPDGGFPVVLNFSYGMQASSKDGRSQWEQSLEALLDDRAAQGLSPVRLVMPVGNDNMERCTARAYLGGDGPWTNEIGKRYEPDLAITVPWRVLPQDHTSNAVEIWANGLDEDGTPPSPEDVRLYLVPPGTETGDEDTCLDRLVEAVPMLQRGQYATHADGFARVYCRGDGSEQLGYVICLSPTERLESGRDHGPADPVAPAGLWRIRMCYAGRTVNAAFYVQSDQPARRDSQTGRQSYFDHHRYRTHLPNGRRRDSFDYESGAHTDNWKDFGPVQIKGTQNALATINEVVVIGGYRLSDGRPTSYSGTTDGKSRRNGAGRAIMDAAYPSDVSPSVFGLLAAGARDGSMVGFRGTSMAAALATRDISIQMRLSPGDRDRIGTRRWLRARADDYRDNRPAHYHDIRRFKGGNGHLPAPDSAGLSRISRS